MKTHKNEAAVNALRSLSLPDIVSAERLAHHLNVSPTTVRAHLRRGDLPGRKIGRRWFVSRRDLLGFLEARPARLRRLQPEAGEVRP